jgi:hypothetical protein
MKTKKFVKMGRLAMRVEGDFWYAYYAMPNSMEEAIWLGCIRMQFVMDAKRKQLFMDLMKSAVADILEDATGERPVWPSPPQRAPENERGGSA